MKTNALESIHPNDGLPIFDIPHNLICFSHLRWDFVYQRPQHLMSRFAIGGDVFFFEEPIFFDGDTHLSVTQRGINIYVCVPYIDHKEATDAIEIQRTMVDKKLIDDGLKEYTLWYYTPMALAFTDHLASAVTVYDCMDELTAFKFADPELKKFEKILLKKADLVFTGGESLYQAKKDLHPKVFSFPSSIDVNHFKKARSDFAGPGLQAKIPAPKLGFLGVIDERMDTALLSEMADLRPEWQFVMIGPVVKISPEELPRRSNIHYLGSKTYDELPAYLSGWDIALMPFAINESTRFISPTKTPEYLAAGKPVISTPIKDVVSPYGDLNLVCIAKTAHDFIAHAERILQQENSEEWLKKVDKFLSLNSWDDTFAVMQSFMSEANKTNKRPKYLKKDSLTKKTRVLVAPLLVGTK